jgi:hypothetical protein
MYDRCIRLWHKQGWSWLWLRLALFTTLALVALSIIRWDGVFAGFRA